MEHKKFLVSLVALVAIFVFAISSVSAFADITSVEVSGISSSGQTIAAFAGQTLPVRVIFDATEDASDVRIKAWISGDRELAVSTERFNVLSGNTYSRLLSVEVPFDIDPSEDFSLFVSVEDKREEADRFTVDLEVQRESFTLDILSIDMDSKVKAGENLAIDVVVKNRGFEEAEDTFVSAKIPALGIERSVFFGDLSAVDESDPDKFDSAERTLFLRIPVSAPVGIYDIEIKAFNDDSSTTIIQKVAVAGAGEDSSVIPSINTRTFAVGEDAVYTMTLVNSGANVRVYELVVEQPSGLVYTTTSGAVTQVTGLTIAAEEPIVAVPAGESRTVRLVARASQEGRYNFAVNVHSDEELVKRETFVANVEGKRSFAGSAAVLLTVVLAIIFIVLLIVLIVLLTRKPASGEEFGESYY